MDRFQAFDQFVEYDQGQFVSLKDKYRGKPYSFRAKVAVAVALEYETCFGLFLFLVGFVRAGLHRRLPRWLWSIKWKNHARNVWSFVSNDRTIGIAAFSVGCLFILAISATLQENRYHRQAFDGVAERRTVTSWVLNYDRIAPCYLSQFHGGGGRGYVCDKPLAFPKPWWQGWFSVKYWGENFFFRNELLMKDSHGPDSKKKWCALGPTAEMPDQNRGRALLVAVVNPFHEALLSVWLCLVGMYFLGKYKFRK